MNCDEHACFRRFLDLKVTTRESNHCKSFRNHGAPRYGAENSFLQP
jgi:hypothetical protein